MAYTSLEQFLTDLPAQAKAAQTKLKGKSGAFRLEIPGGASYGILLTDGLITLPDEMPAQPDCTVTAAESTLLDLLNGKLNPAKALLFRKVTVKGNSAKLLSLLSAL